MKRFGNLWPKIIAYDNLLHASRQAQRGKRFRDNVLDFNFHLESELERLESDLKTQSYRPGAYKSFRIYDPKPRLISAAPYRDRVVHHALCNVIMPLIERRFITDSYANRVGFGSHRALKRFTQFARSKRYILQCDIKKYFPSIDHDILKMIIRRSIKCPETLWLIDLIIDSSNPQDAVLEYFPGDDLLTPLQRRHGLPIGNLTSQFFANVYLDFFDHYVKEDLHIHSYLRYVDDFALFSDDRSVLAEARPAITAYLSRLRLTLHPIKTQLFETRYGANFVGFRVLPDRIRVRNDNLHRARKRCRKIKEAYAQDLLQIPELCQRLQAWEAHLKHGDTYRLRHRIFNELIFSRVS